MFAYDEAVADRYPTIRAGVIHATNLANGPSAPGCSTSTALNNEAPPKG
jgi:hypothetical protein